MCGYLIPDDIPDVLVEDAAHFRSGPLPIHLEVSDVGIEEGLQGRTGRQFALKVTFSLDFIFGVGADRKTVPIDLRLLAGFLEADTGISPETDLCTLGT